MGRVVQDRVGRTSCPDVWTWPVFRDVWTSCGRNPVRTWSCFDQIPIIGLFYCKRTNVKSTNLLPDSCILGSLVGTPYYKVCGDGDKLTYLACQLGNAKESVPCESHDVTPVKTISNRRLPWGSSSYGYRKRDTSYVETIDFGRLDIRDDWFVFNYCFTMWNFHIIGLSDRLS